MALHLQPASTAVGVICTGVQINKLSDGEFEAVKEAFFDHGVIFFLDQDLTPEDHIAFAERWAEIDINRFFSPVPGYPQIAQVLKEPDQTRNIGGGWHTDHSYDQVPAMGSILRAIELPGTGGDTLFASTQAAYEGLSDEVKALIEPLKATHSSRQIFGYGAEEAEEIGDRFVNPEQATQDALHPIALAHPVTGRKGIYVNAAFTTGIEGMDTAEAEPILKLLYSECIKPEYHFRFQWKPGSIAMWDNRSTWHWAINDYHGQRRYMHRITLKGVALT